MDCTAWPQVLGEVGALPDVYTELEVNFFLLRRLLGVRTTVRAPGALGSCWGAFFVCGLLGRCFGCAEGWGHLSMLP